MDKQITQPKEGLFPYISYIFLYWIYKLILKKFGRRDKEKKKRKVLEQRSPTFLVPWTSSIGISSGGWGRDGFAWNLDPVHAQMTWPSSQRAADKNWSVA